MILIIMIIMILLMKIMIMVMINDTDNNDLGNDIKLMILDVVLVVLTFYDNL